MATAVKKCRVCGKEYQACRTLNHNADIFRWQDVACSPECGGIYLARIEESRGITPVKTAAATHKELVDDTPALDMPFTEDIEDEEIFDDEDLDEME